MLAEHRPAFLVSCLLVLVSLPSLVSASALSSSNFVVDFDSIDTSLARSILDYSEKSFRQVTGQLNHVPETKILIVLVSSQEAFDRWMGDEAPEWGVAFAFCSRNKIILKSPRLTRKNVNLAEVVTHEVTHVILQSFLGHARIPLWLNEGFAMYQSREWQIGNSSVVGWAAIRNRLYDLGDLDETFPWSEKGARLAYAESFLAVAYIVQHFGKQGLMNLLKDVREGKDIDLAMRRSLGLGYERFKREWLENTKSRFSIASFVLSPITVWVFVVVLLVIVYIKRKQRKKKKLASMDSEHFFYGEGDLPWKEYEHDE